jgi:hypothetical protein
MFNETEEEVSMEVKGVCGVIHGLVRSTEAKEVGCDDPRATL